MAMLMARLYTGNYDMLALRNCYHGMSEGTMGVTAHSTWKFSVPQVGGLRLKLHNIWPFLMLPHAMAQPHHPSCCILSCSTSDLEKAPVW